MYEAGELMIVETKEIPVRGLQLPLAQAEVI